MTGRMTPRPHTQAWSATACFLFPLLTQVAANRSLTITTIHGEIRCNALRGGVAECLGIPFASAPVGSLRWHPPQDWTGPLVPTETPLGNASHQAHRAVSAFNATSFGPSCPQAAGQLLNASAISEDCLTVNIWSSRHEDITLAPVLVFFYGGSFVQGGSSTYNGSVLARKHGAVVVTANYRLGALGFAALPWNDGMKNGIGNFGLLDQQSALRWTRRTIFCFGGDAKRVTIFGQSAGAESVAYHLMMSSSRGLFSRAILESPSLLWAKPLDFSLGIAKEFAKNLNCSGLPVEKLACLRNRSVASILAVQSEASGPTEAGNPSFSCLAVEGCRDFYPTADEVLLKDTALELARKGLVNGDVDIIAGTCTNDGSLFAVDYYETLNASTYSGFVRTAVSMYSQAMHMSIPQPHAILQALQLYPPAPSSIPIEEQTSQNVASLERILTDSQYVCQTRLIANATTRAGAKAWLYRFDYNATWLKPCYNTWPAPYGNATHTAELSFVFGQPLYVFGPPTAAAPPCSFTDREEAFADHIGSMWSLFASGSAPASSSSWPVFSADADQNLILDPSERLESGWHAKVCKFWNGDLTQHSPSQATWV